MTGFEPGSRVNCPLCGRPGIIAEQSGVGGYTTAYDVLHEKEPRLPDWCHIDLLDDAGSKSYMPGEPGPEATDLVEFLLARIAEDETIVRKAMRAYQHVFGIPHYFTANNETSVAMNPRVALTECEAKRRIVELHGQQEELVDVSCLRLLALPYADHEDYRPEWRP